LTLSEDEADLKVGSAWIFDRVFAARSQALANAATFDLDLLDLGTYDLGNGAGRDSLGLGHSNATIHYIRIRCQSTSTGSLTVDGSQTNGWTEFIPTTHVLAPGDEIFGKWVTGKVVDATHKILRFTAGGGDLTYDIDFLPTQT
jgi:hypothetical protein